MRHQIKCHGNTRPERHECALYAAETEVKKTEPDEDSGKKCKFFRKKGGLNA